MNENPTLALPPDSFVIDSTFTDFEAFKEALTGWKLDLRQLERGHPSIRMIWAGCGEIHLGYLACNRRYERRTMSPQGRRTFALLAGWSSEVNLGEAKLDDRSLLCFPRNDAIAAVSAPDLRLFTITVPEAALIARSETLGYPQVGGLLEDQGKHFQIPYAQLEPLRTCLQTRSACLSQYSSNPHGLHAHHSQAVDLLIVALASQYPAEYLDRPRAKWKALRRALDYIEGHASYALIKVRDLAIVSGACERTLERAFLEYFGIGPKSYLLALRLNRVRRALLAADPRCTTVENIAVRWGFWHMSQFARDYRKLFDELPSTTLKRASISIRKSY